MLKHDGLTVLYQHLISPEVSSGEPGTPKGPLILTTTLGDGEYAIWLTCENTPRRIFRTALGGTARCVHDDIKAMTFAIAMRHWIEAEYKICSLTR